VGCIFEVRLSLDCVDLNSGRFMLIITPLRKTQLLFPRCPVFSLEHAAVEASGFVVGLFHPMQVAHPNGIERCVLRRITLRLYLYSAAVFLHISCIFSVPRGARSAHTKNSWQLQKNERAKRLGVKTMLYFQTTISY
jgi:hypothetical protein